MLTSLRHIFFLLILVACTPLALAQEIPSKGEKIPPAEPKTEEPTQRIKTDSLLTNIKEVQPDSTSVAQDSTKKKPKNQLDFILETQAQGYRRIDRKNNTITLYDQAVVIYGDIKLEAGRIVIDNTTGDIYAYGIVIDSTGAYEQKPIFTQGPNVVKPDSIIANKDTRKVLTYNSQTKQNEFNVIAETVKRVNDSTYFMRNAKFTTSDNPEDPEYYFLARRTKFVPDKKIVTGAVNMYIADVPTPLLLPFGYFPIDE